MRERNERAAARHGESSVANPAHRSPQEFGLVHRILVQHDFTYRCWLPGTRHAFKFTGRAWRHPDCQPVGFQTHRPGQADTGGKQGQPQAEDAEQEGRAHTAEQGRRSTGRCLCRYTDLFANVPQQLKALKSEFDSLRSHLTCKICDRLLYQPYTISCGHTYCYTVRRAPCRCTCHLLTSPVSLHMVRRQQGPQDMSRLPHRRQGPTGPRLCGESACIQPQREYLTQLARYVT